jgi:flagellar biosynthesis protein FlhF
LIYRQAGQTSAQAMRAIRSRYGEDVIVISTLETPEGVDVLFTLDEASAMQAAHALPGLPALRDKPAGGQSDAARQLQPQSTTPPPVAGAVDRTSGIGGFADWLSADAMRADLWQTLTEQGFSSDVAQAVLDRMPAGLGRQQATAHVLQTLFMQLQHAQPDTEWVDTPGVYALVGPTGSGKTTTLAKVAARCLAIHGKGSVAIVTTDTYRIGAVDQLKIYGRVLGVNVHVAASHDALQQVIQANRDVRLLLVDTMGLSPRDSRTQGFVQAFDTLGVRKVLVLNASSQAAVQQDVIERFKGTGLAGCVMAKLDETLSLGATLDVLLRNHLPVMYLAAGQRVPEDLHLPDAFFVLYQAMPQLVQACYDVSAHESRWRRLGLLPALQSSPVDVSEATF